MKKKRVNLSRLELKKEQIGNLTSVTGGVFIGTVLPPKGTAYTCIPELCASESCPDTTDCFTKSDACPNTVWCWTGNGPSSCCV